VTNPHEEQPYDALLLVSFGGPEGPDDVRPFLENVTRGRGIPEARLAAVAERYYELDGVSPINQANRELRDALAERLDIPVYWGNRNWHPLLADTVRTMRDDGVRQSLAYITSVFASYSGCRQYLENIADARNAVGPDAPRIDRLRHGFDHPGFVEAFVDSTCRALTTLPLDMRADARLAFTAHSIPVTMAAASGPNGGLYEAQLAAAAALITAGVEARTGVHYVHDLVYQSRSGRPDDPWLGPDLSEYLATIDVPAVLVVPLGFTADHMEVVYDLDIQAVMIAEARGIVLARAATPGTHPAYVEMIVELVRERLDPTVPRRALSPLGPSYDDCPSGCCLGSR
jgi:ferrochelatase